MHPDRAPLHALARALGAPVVRKDLRGRRDAWPWAAAIVAYALLTAAGALIGFRIAASGPAADGTQDAWRAAGAGASLVLLGLNATVPVVLAACDLGGEHERGTLALLLLTALPSRAIVSGKVLSAAASVVLPSAAALPVLALTAAAGDVPPALAAVGALILCLTTVTGAALGALIGCAVRTRARATAAGLAAGGAILTSAPIAATLALGATRALLGGVPAGLQSRALGWWATAGGITSAIHPFAAAASTAAVWLRQGTVATMTVSPARPLALPAPWVPYTVFGALLCAALVVAGAAVLDARRAV